MIHFWDVNFYLCIVGTSDDSGNATWIVLNHWYAKMGCQGRNTFQLGIAPNRPGLYKVSRHLLSCTKNSVKYSCCLSERELTGFQCVKNGNKKCIWKWLVASRRSYWSLLSDYDYLACTIPTIHVCLPPIHIYMDIKRADSCGNWLDFIFVYLKMLSFFSLFFFKWS